MSVKSFSVINTNGNKEIEKNGGKDDLARWKDFKIPKRLTKDQKELREAFGEAMQR